MAEWGWRSPRQVKDPVLRSIFQSLERYLIDGDQAVSGDLAALVAAVAAAQGDASQALGDAAAAQVAADAAQVTADESSVLDGVDNGGVPEVSVRWTVFGVNAGVPFFDADGVVGADQAWMTLNPVDGVPTLVEVG